MRKKRACCSVGCTRSAEYEIYAEGKGLDPYCNITDACTEHLGALLGTFWPDFVKGLRAKSWVVVPIKEECAPNDPRTVGDALAQTCPPSAFPGNAGAILDYLLLPNAGAVVSPGGLDAAAIALCFCGEETWVGLGEERRAYYRDRALRVLNCVGITTVGGSLPESVDH